jgi:chromosome transmission fidelity protein 18
MTSERVCLFAFLQVAGQSCDLCQTCTERCWAEGHSKGLFSVWQDIFLIERSGVGSENKNVTLKDRMTKVLNVVNSFGDYEKVAQGVFENYTNMKYKSSNMSETCWAMEWFSYSDILNQQIYSSQSYSLSSYLQFAFVVWHFAFSSRTWQKLNYPNAGYEVRINNN